MVNLPAKADTTQKWMGSPVWVIFSKISQHVVLWLGGLNFNRDSLAKAQYINWSKDQREFHL